MSQDICQDDKYVPYYSVITVNHLSAELMRGVWELNSDQHSDGYQKNPSDVSRVQSGPA